MTTALRLVEGSSMDKSKALDAALSQIERNFGKGAIMRLGKKTNLWTSIVSTGTICIDLALGVGGFPRGRVVEIYGPESSGKTTLALRIAWRSPEEGRSLRLHRCGACARSAYARSSGQCDDLLISQPDSGEQALEITETLVRSGAIDVIVLDSVAALVPRAELEGEMGDSQLGLQAR